MNLRQFFKSTLFLVLYLYTNIIIGQQNTEVDIYIKIADPLHLHKKEKEATSYLEKSIAILESQQEWKSIVHCYNQLTKVQFEIRKWEAEKIYANSALTILEKLETTSKEEGYAHWHKRNMSNLSKSIS